MLSIKSKDVSWGLVAIEAIAIFLSVLLAFGVSEWREVRREKATVQAAFDNFRQEITANRLQLQERFDYHTAVYEGFNDLESGPVLSSIEEAFGRLAWHGPRQVHYRDGARSAAEATGAYGMMDFPIAQQIASIYDQQDHIEDIQSSLAKAGFNPDFFAESNLEPALISLTVYFDIIVEAETDLIARYDLALSELAKRLGPRVQMDSTSSE